MKLYITRHGQTDWNLNNKIQGTIDIALNETGRQQAGITRDDLAGVAFDRIITSPLMRAYETAQIINERHGVEVMRDERISERAFGVYEGSSLDNVDFTCFWRPEEEHRFPSCEKTSLFYKRIYDFIDEAKVKYANETILIVAHGGVSLPFYTYFNGMPGPGDMRKYMLNNCVVAYYEV